MSIKPKNFGVIVRTVAEGKRVAELDGELKVLLKHWEDAVTKIQKATKFPTLIYEETSRAVGLLRDLFNPSFENIHVNDEAGFSAIGQPSLSSDSLHPSASFLFTQSAS